MRCWNLLPPILLVLLCGGCERSPSLSAPGPPFAMTDEAPPGKALIYVYWPRETTGRRDGLDVRSCLGHIEDIQPGGYVVLPEQPGQGCVVAESHWEIKHANTFGSLELASLDLNVEAGRTYFVRLQREQSFLTPRVALHPVERAAARREIKACRRMVLAPPEEIYRRLSGQESVP